MEIEIAKYKGKNQKPEIKDYPILDFKTVNYSSNLLLIIESKMGVERGKDKEECDFSQITKIQFIAVCKIELAECVLIAFYLGEGGELLPYIISGLPLNYYQDIDRGIIIDYKSYSEICEITEEKKLPLSEYIEQVKNATLGLNSLMISQGKVLNFDQQTALWAEIDKNN